MLGLILPLVLLGAVLAYRSRGKAWRRLVAPRLRTQLVSEAPQTRRWLALSFGLLGCLLLIFVIARPYKGKTTMTEEVRTRNILIAVDTSRSMLVKDGSPDRMASAKAMALEITNTFPNDRIGIIAFSGASVLLAPMTIDHLSIRDTIGQLDTEIIPSGGSNLAAAAKTAIKTFDKMSHNSNALIIISDGEDHSQAIENVAEQIREGKFAVSTVAVGTKDGGMIPDPRYPDGKYRDVRGNPVHSKMLPDALVTLSEAGGGKYTEASSGAPAIIRDSLAFLESDQQEGRQISLPNEQYHWFLIPAILCLIASMITRSNLISANKSTPVAVGLILLISIFDSRAATDLELATSAYENKDYPAAMESFEKALNNAKGDDQRAIEFSLGSTAYRMKDWSQASRYFSKSLLTTDKSLRESSHYNMGNTLFQSAWSLFKPANDPDEEEAKNTTSFKVDDIKLVITQLEDAVTHYSAALELNNQHEDSLFNRREAEKLLEKLKEQQKEEEEQKDDGEPQQGKGDKPKEKGDQSEQKGQGNQPSDNPEKGDQDQPPEKPDDGDSNKSEQGEQPDQPAKEQKQQPGETDEAYAARILKDNSDAETRPVKSRFLRMRRPAKDW